uniref:DNA mismatch repair protein MSH7 n=1 Tax=Rhizophora mucronata TaxID=61149 RepID=A0A2P2KHA4_RHIMU
MQRQTSILSFFEKPLPAEQKSGAGQKRKSRPASQFPSKPQNENVTVSGEPGVRGAGAVDSSLEIRGTDTPPEKVPRQILPANFAASQETGGSSLFSSIMHKFVRVNHGEETRDKNKSHGPSSKDWSISDTFLGQKQLLKQGFGDLHPESNIDFSSNNMVDQGCPLPIEVSDDVPMPETPGVCPRVPRFKQIRDDIPKFEDKNGHSLLDASKKVKIQEATSLSNNHPEKSDSTSKFEWLDPSQIKDGKGRRPGDPFYDKKTLYLPANALRKMSASQKQYWSVKSQYMDVVLFFKVGKFYELYELDAEIGHKELDWKMTGSGVGKCRQVGISESGIDDAVEKLVARGYKVGRMEQLETSDQAKARGANSVIPRKLFQVVTPATLTDGNIGPDAVHLLAIKEGSNGPDNGQRVYGFAFVDCAALRFWVGYISDDASCVSLGALLMQVSPKEVVYEARGLSKETQKALRKYSSTGSTALQLTPATDFVDASEVKNLIQLKGYFQGSSHPWTNDIESMMYQDVTLCALSGLIGHLSRLMLDNVLRSGDILPYQVFRGCLRMDGQTLVNLEIFSNNADGGLSGTLFKYLDNCVTPSGKRLLREWICHPLKCVEGINNRLNVVDNLIGHSEIIVVIAQCLRKVPDLERMFGRIRANFQASTSLAVPLIGKKLLKQRVSCSLS